MPPAKGSKYKRRQPKPSGLLQDMRWVYQNPTTHPDTPGRELCRRILDKGVENFVATLARMEKEHASQGGGEEEAVKGAIKDEASENVEVLIERLLSEAEREAGVSVLPAQQAQPSV